MPRSSRHRVSAYARRDQIPNDAERAWATLKSAGPRSISGRGQGMSATKFPIPPPLSPRSSATSFRPRPEESRAYGGNSAGRHIGRSPTFAIHRDWGEGHLAPVTAPSRQGTRFHSSGSSDGGSFLEARRIAIGISPTFAIHRGWRPGHLAPVPAIRLQGRSLRDSKSCDGGS